MEKEQIYQSDGNIDIIKLIKILLNKWLFILVFSSLFLIGSILYALNIDPVFKSEALLAPHTGSSTEMRKVMSNMGGISGMMGAGLTIDTEDNSRLALPVLKSRDFLYTFIEKRDLLVPLMASKSWDVSDGSFKVDRKRYNQDTKEWIDQEGNATTNPDPLDAFLKLQDTLNVSEEVFTGFVTISLEHPTPQKTKEWLNWIIEDINEYFREADRKEAEEAINYLHEQMGKNTLSSLEKVFSSLIESQTRILMMVNSKKGYVYRTLDQAYEPDMRIRPRRTMIVVALSGLGGLISVFFVLISYFSGYDFSFSSVFPPKLNFHKIPTIK